VIRVARSAEEPAVANPESTAEKKDDPQNAKGDKGHEKEDKEKEQQENPHQQAGSGGRGGHHKRTGGNPDGSNG
jgi:hypothetical protein